jgi:nitroreductase
MLLVAWYAINIVVQTAVVHAFTSFSYPITTHFASSSSPLKSTAESVLTFDEAVDKRYACTRYQRYDNLNTTTTTSASPPDPLILKQAMKVLEMARRAPTGFNAQPYKLLVVSSPDAKLKLAKYCIGHNAHRVRDSDCTVLFLADRQVMREWSNYRKYLLSSDSNNKMTWMKLTKIRLLIGMFSSGLPLPQFLSGPLMFAFRLAMRMLSWILCQPFKVLLTLPTLSSSQTWAEKNTMLVAMSYLLGCASRNIATTPMEGYLTWGIRRSFQIPRRYSLPLIVATGRPFVRNATAYVGKDDAGLTHGNTPATSSRRYPSNMTIYENHFGNEYSNHIV